MREFIKWVLPYVFLSKVCGYNILIASDMASPSHKLWNYALAEGLVKEGHNVTMLAPDNMKQLGKQSNNYHDIFFEGMMEKVYSEEWNLEDLRSEPVLTGMFWYYGYVEISCRYAMESPGLKIILDYPEDFKFDVILFDTTYSACLLPLMKKFNYPPSIAITAFLLPHYLSLQFGNEIHPAYAPSYLVDFSSDMNFWQRLQHYIWINLDLFLRKYYMKPRVDQIMRAQFGQDMESIEELESRLSLLLCNIEPSFHNTQPVPQNIIPVGGLHIKPAGKLTQDIQNILDTAKDGVILFALGTNVRSDQLGPLRIKILLESFSKIKQIVLWKFESDLTAYKVPGNVIIRKWLPQNEILAHPNIKLFISHAGGLSSLEATYHGVPVLGMPFFLDQHQNLHLMEEKQVARSLVFETLNEDRILENIRIMLEEPKYTKAAKEISKRMRDQPQTPLEKAIYWIEYTIRHNGTHFLDPRSRRMPLFTSTSMDVKLFLLGLLLAIMLFVQRGISLFQRCLRHNVEIKKKID